MKKFLFTSPYSYYFFYVCIIYYRRVFYKRLHISFRLIVRYVTLFYIYYTDLKVGEIFARIENIEAPDKCKMDSCKITRTYHAQHYRWIKIPPKFHSEERINDKRWIKKQREHVRKTLKGIKERSRKRGNGLEMLDDKDEQRKRGTGSSFIDCPFDPSNNAWRREISTGYAPHSVENNLFERTQCVTGTRLKTRQISL